MNPRENYFEITDISTELSIQMNFLFFLEEIIWFDEKELERCFAYITFAALIIRSQCS